jgi:hypothetical protein
MKTVPRHGPKLLIQWGRLAAAPFLRAFWEKGNARHEGAGSGLASKMAHADD